MKQITVVKNTASYNLLYLDKKMLDVEIEYPAIICKKSQKRCISKSLNSYYRKKTLELNEYAQSELYPSAIKQYDFTQKENFPFNSYILQQVYTITFNSYPLISLYRDKYEYTGGAHGMTFRLSETWNTISNKKLSLADLFKQKCYYKKIIIEQVLRESLQRQKDEMVTFFDSLKANLKKYFSEQNYYLTPTGITIYYPLYSIAPYSEGIQEYSIPYSLFDSNIHYKLGNA